MVVVVVGFKVKGGVNACQKVVLNKVSVVVIAEVLVSH